MAFLQHMHFPGSLHLFKENRNYYLVFHWGNLGLVLISCHQKVPVAEIVFYEGLDTIMVGLVTRSLRWLQLGYSILSAARAH